MTNGAKYTLVVVFLCLAIAIVVGVNVTPTTEAPRQATIAELRVVIAAIEAYRQAENSYPPVLQNDSSDNLCQQLVAVPKAVPILAYLPACYFQPPLKLVDGWGKAIFYRSTGRGVAVVSAGPDGIYGTKDDIQEEATPEMETPAPTQPSTSTEPRSIEH
jgi:type II secretory pathway pseudopilin PulG